MTYARVRFWGPGLIGTIQLFRRELQTLWGGGVEMRANPVLLGLFSDRAQEAALLVSLWH